MSKDLLIIIKKILDKNFQELKLDSIKQLENTSEILKSAVDQLKKVKQIWNILVINKII